MRKIPTTMATQHPDNAGAPHWDTNGNPFVNIQRELADCLDAYQELGILEYMWDWEGKYADASVVDKLYGESYDYFHEHPLGNDRFLTFRLPNIWEEKGYSLLQAMTVMLTAEDFAKDLGFKSRPLFEVILPMTMRADQLMHMHHLFGELARFKNKVFNTNGVKNDEMMEMIPLVEGVSDQQGIAQLLKEYIEQYQTVYGEQPTYVRPFIACSDPALSSGWLAARLANLDALSQIQQLSDETGIPMHPIAGVGSLPFRGGLSPQSAHDFALRYPGVRTATVQSSFRFDHPLSQVKKAIKQLETSLADSKSDVFDKDTTQHMRAIARHAEGFFQDSLKGIVSDIQPIFAAVPRRRERRMHTGLLGYGRKSGTVKMPRAITFTAGLYSLGVPPEFIGLGRTLATLSKEEHQTLHQTMQYLSKEVETAGRYLNQSNLELLAKRNKAWAPILEDVRLTERELGIRLGPRTHAEKSHRNVTSNVLLMKNNTRALGALITETAVLRRSLG